MKYFFLLTLFFNCSSAQSLQDGQLQMLTPSKVLKDNILEQGLKYSLYPEDILMLRIIQCPENNLENPTFELRICSLEISDFQHFKFTKDRYFGYFKYKEHTVLVYGDDGVKYFFSRTSNKMDFPFLFHQPYDDDKNPPVSIEPVVTCYKFSRSEFKMTEEGRIGFGN